MAEGVWKGVYPEVFGRSKQLSLNKFFDPSTPSMRQGNSGEENRERRRKRRAEKKTESGEENGERGDKRRMRIVATTSLPAVESPTPHARAKMVCFLSDS